MKLGTTGESRDYSGGKPNVGWDDPYSYVAVLDHSAYRAARPLLRTFQTNRILLRILRVHALIAHGSQKEDQPRPDPKRDGTVVDSTGSEQMRVYASVV